MRRITAGPLAAFLSLVAVALLLAWALLEAPTRWLLEGASRGAGYYLTLALVFYVACIAAYRAYLRVFPLKIGEIAPNTMDEFHYHVYLLFCLVFFQPLTRSLLVPVPLMRVLYIALGAKFGANTYSGGTILDPPLTTLGDNTIIGHDAVIFSHVIEGDRLALVPVRIGSNVTIGAKSIVMPGVQVGDGAIVGVGSIVRKNTRIGEHEVWTGNPAQRRPARTES